MMNPEHEEWLGDEKIRKQQAKDHAAAHHAHVKKPPVPDEKPRKETPPWTYDGDP